MEQAFSSEENQTSFPWRFTAGVLVLIWIIHLAQFFLGTSFHQWGILPRQVEGLKGILFGPLIHGSWSHLTSNSVPLVVLSIMLFYFYPKKAWVVWWSSYFFPGLCVWLVANLDITYDTYHIGISGLIYSLAFFLFFMGVFSKERRAMALALVVAFLYGGIVWGVLPLQPHVSWEGHLFGAVTGIALALNFRKHGPQRKKYSWELEEEPPEMGFEPWNYKKWFPAPDEFEEEER
ncbi:MAG: rhomboid family intramembrane serine protease [Bacteroidota bacterium]